MDYEQGNLFDLEDNVIEDKQGYSLILTDKDDYECFYDIIESYTGQYVDYLSSEIDYSQTEYKEYLKSDLRKQFLKIIAKDIKERRNETVFRGLTYKSSGKKGYLEKLNKSDTLVIHRNDPSTVMLKQIYEGKGWDVLQDDYIDKTELHELLKSHERLVLLGHGSPYGLMGGNIGPDEATYLKGKKLFIIRCNADQYFTKHDVGQGAFVTGNMPSDSGEAAWVGFHVSEHYMLENITYWCKLCADVCPRALEGDAEGAVKYVRDKYWERYGQGYDVTEVSDDGKVKQDIPDEVRITKYNWVRTKVQK